MFEWKTQLLENYLLVVAGFVYTLLLILLLLTIRRGNHSRFFAASVFFLLLWVLCILVFNLQTEPWLVELTAKMTFMCGALLTYFYYLFVIEFTDGKSLKSNWWFVVYTALNSFAAIITFSDDFMYVVASETRMHTYYLGPIYLFYLSVLILNMILVFYRIIQVIRMSNDYSLRRQLKIIAVGTFPSTIMALLFNLILPYFHVISMHSYGPIFSISFVLVTAIAIFKYKIFNFKLIFAQLFIFLLCTTLLLRLITSQGTTDLVLNTFTLLTSGILGYILSKSIGKEIESKEILERQKIELEATNSKLEELSRQKSEFLSIATHQLRTPLGAMTGYTSLVLGGSFGEISDKIKEVLGKVLQSGMLMNGTIEDFLSVSRIDQGRMVYDMTDFPIQKLTKEVFDELKAGAERKGLILKYEVPDTDFLVHADYGKLKHVVSNLIDNSIKYTREGWVRISAEVVGGYVRVSISDSGVGIPADELPKLFDKFVRARGASGVNVSGTGLGLYVAKQMIEAHKGKVWAESAGEGKGSTFIAELPIA